MEVGLEDDTATVEFYHCRCIMAANRQNYTTQLTTTVTLQKH